MPAETAPRPNDDGDLLPQDHDILSKLKNKEKEGVQKFESQDFKGAAKKLRKMLKAGQPILSKPLFFKNKVDIRARIGLCYYYLELYSKAEIWDRKTLSEAEEINRRSMQSWTTRHNLAKNLAAQARKDISMTHKLEEALSLYERNLIQAMKWKSGKDEVFETVHHVAFCLAHQGDYMTAVWLEEQNLRYRRRLHRKRLKTAADAQEQEKTFANMVESRHNYATFLYLDRQFEEAKSHFHRNMVSLKTLSGCGIRDLHGLVTDSKKYIENCDKEIWFEERLKSLITKEVAEPHDYSSSDQNSFGRTKRKREESPEDARTNAEPEVVASGGFSQSSSESSHRPQKRSRRNKSPKSSRRSEEMEDISQDILWTPDVHTEEEVWRANSEAFFAVAASPEQNKQQKIATYSIILKMRDASRKLLCQFKDPAPVKVAILDTGAEFPKCSVPSKERKFCEFLSHKKYQLQQYADFQGVASLEDSPGIFQRDESEWKDIDGHGTQCVSVLLQASPRAHVYVARVAESSGTVPRSICVAAAIKHAVETWDVDIISMSFGYHFEKPDIDEQLERATSKYLTPKGKNVLVFAAASNDGNNDPRIIAWPARRNNVIAVYPAKASGKPTDSCPAAHGGEGFMALGEHITVPQVIAKIKDGIAGEQTQQSGSSFATPFLAGSAALLLEFCRVGPLFEQAKGAERYLRRRDGISAVFRMIAGNNPVDKGLYLVQLGKFLDPVRAITGKNDTFDPIRHLAGRIYESLGGFGNADLKRP